MTTEHKLEDNDAFQVLERFDEGNRHIASYICLKNMLCYDIEGTVDRIPAERFKQIMDWIKQLEQSGKKVVYGRANAAIFNVQTSRRIHFVLVARNKVK